MDNHFDHIDDYLLERLDGKQLEAFLEEMKVNEALQVAVDEQRTIMGYLEVAEDEKLFEQVRSIHQNNTCLSTNKSPRIKAVGLLIAVVLVLCLAILAYFELNKKPTSQELFATYYSTQEINFGTRTGESDTDLRLIQAGKHYADGNYRQALDLFDQVLEQENNAKVILAKGICLFEINDTDRALNVFDQLILDKDVLYEDHARWYAALTHLSKNEPEKAKQILGPLARNPNSFYFQKAQQLLKELP